MNNRKLKKLLRENMLYKEQTESRATVSPRRSYVWGKVVKASAVLAAIALVCVGWVGIMRFVGPATPGANVPGTDNVGADMTEFPSTYDTIHDDLIDDTTQIDQPDDTTQIDQPDDTIGLPSDDTIGLPFWFSGSTVRVAVSDNFGYQLIPDEITGNYIFDAVLQNFRDGQKKFDISVDVVNIDGEDFADTMARYNSDFEIYIAPYGEIEKLSGLSSVPDFETIGTLFTIEFLFVNERCLNNDNMAKIYDTIRTNLDSYNISYFTDIMTPCLKNKDQGNITRNVDEFLNGSSAFYIGTIDERFFTSKEILFSILPVPTETGFEVKAAKNAPCFCIINGADEREIQAGQAALSLIRSAWSTDEIKDLFKLRYLSSLAQAALFDEILKYQSD